LKKYLFDFIQTTGVFENIGLNKKILLKTQLGLSQ